jgi:hypothetical protein
MGDVVRGYLTANHWRNLICTYSRHCGTKFNAYASAPVEQKIKEFDQEDRYVRVSYFDPRDAYQCRQ